MKYLIKLSIIINCIIYTAFTLNAQNRIVSTDGTLSEIVCELGLQSHIVGIDVTSTFPESLQKLPKVGHNRNISAEGILALNPDLVLVNEKGMIKNETVSQLKTAGKTVVIFKQEYSPEGTKKLIREVAAYFKLSKKGEDIIKKIETDLKGIKKSPTPHKILFIYARGTGSLMVSGEGTSVEKMIQLSGNENAGKGFKDFKPLTPEALLTANPDVILLFNSGLESVGNVEGLLHVPGIVQTNAGKSKKIITMDGQYLTGFGPRLGKAVAELAQKSNQ
jgi:iron complex transport system substrate-binding protein